ncbi:hypothetical protein H4W33_006273 [Kibdelosporangium phytohabitans]|nr:hypothetical protein [Kibdelosporangium phytohabitans]
MAIVREALAAPLHWIASNAGLEGAVVVHRVREADWGHGLNAAKLTYGDLVAEGIIDPVKVTRSAVTNAASIARMVLTTESSVVEKKEEEPPAAGHDQQEPCSVARRRVPLLSKRSRQVSLVLALGCHPLCGRVRRLFVVVMRVAHG